MSIVCDTQRKPMRTSPFWLKMKNACTIVNYFMVMSRNYKPKSCFESVSGPVSCARGGLGQSGHGQGVRCVDKRKVQGQATNLTNLCYLHMQTQLYTFLSIVLISKNHTLGTEPLFKKYSLFTEPEMYRHINTYEVAPPVSQQQKIVKSWDLKNKQVLCK